MAQNIWRDQRYHSGEVIHYAERPDKTRMEVTENSDGSETIHVMAPDRSSEYLMGELEDITVNEAIARAESVVLPDEDTGI